jgi:hypothetical protein
MADEGVADAGFAQELPDGFRNPLVQDFRVELPINLFRQVFDQGFFELNLDGALPLQQQL